MSNQMSSVEEYVRSLDLPEHGPMYESANLPQFTEQREAVAIGSQLAEFTAAVPVAARMPIANSLLLAQLAANKAASQSQDVFEWYKKFGDVLQGIGWRLQDFDFQTQTVANRNGDLHKEIVPVLALMLGPQAAAASIVLSVLNGLKQMDVNSSWIALFDRASQHATGAKFQVSYVDADAQGTPQITLVCFSVKAEKTITQVLFFKFSAQTAELKKGSSKLSVGLDRLQTDKAAIENRVQAFISEFIQSIEI